MSLSHRRINDKKIDTLMDDVYRVLNELKSKSDKINILTDENGQAFLEIDTGLGKARSAIDVFQVGGRGNHTILGDLVGNISSNVLGKNATGNQIYNIISYIPYRVQLDQSEFGSNYELFTIREGFVIDKIDVIVTTAFDNSAQFRINNGSSDILTNTQTAKILPLVGNHEFRLDYSKYSADSTLTLYTTNSPTTGDAVIIIHYRDENYDVKSTV